MHSSFKMFGSNVTGSFVTVYSFAAINFDSKSLHNLHFIRLPADRSKHRNHYIYVDSKCSKLYFESISKWSNDKNSELHTGGTRLQSRLRH